MKFARMLVSICFVFCLAQAFFAANYTVTKIADTNDGTCDADCSLREAVAAANAAATNDAVYFALPLFATTQTITLATGEIVFANNGTLTIYGTGANRLTISGNNASRIFASGANVVVNLHHLRLTGGNGVGAVNTGRGGAVYNVGGTMLITNSVLTGNSAANGGALNNAASSGPAVNATLTLENCAVSNNSSTSSGAAMQNFSTSTLHIRNTSVINNTSSGTGIAGAIQANGTVTITNSTFSGNSAPAGTGGGVYYNGSSMIMTNTTIAGNSSSLGGGGLHRTGTNPTLIMRNTIIANNAGAAATPDVAGLVSSQGNNLIGNVGTSTGWIMSDLQNQNPLLAPLGFYGGNGFTHALLSTSPALNGGQNCVTDLSCAAGNPPVAVAKDQRGAARPSGAAVDIGAFEDSASYRAILPSAVLNVPYNYVFSNSSQTITYSISGSLPPGLNFSMVSVSEAKNLTPQSVGLLSGTPTVPGAYEFTLNVSDGGNTASVNYQLNVLSNQTLVPVTGRVVDAGGSGIGKTYVFLTDQNGNSRFAITNGFGYFHFGEVPVGTTFTLAATSKRYTFAPQTVTIVEATNDLNIAATP